ncbi:MAG: hypothetical protein E6Q49_03845 [Limnohabitans sp.]|nr:MAG: hypothetical protein E6Q49_03845 [Limnohabitans sp.]
MINLQSAFKHFILLGFVCLIWLPVSSFALDVDAIPKSAQNCDLSIPPETSGEDAGIAVFKIFPRRRTVANNYTGCQTIWMQSNMDYQVAGVHIEWVKINLLYFENGRLRAMAFGEDLENSKAGICRYSDGKPASGEERSCKISLDGGLMPTFAPGCMSKAIEIGTMSEECTRSKD